MGDPIGWGCPTADNLGRIIACSCWNYRDQIDFSAPDSLTPQFSVVVPEGTRDIRSCWGAGRSYAIVRGQQTGRAYVLREDGAIVSMGVTNGNQSVGIMAMPYGILAVYVIPGAKYIKWAFDWDLQTISTVTLDQPQILWPGTSQGFLRLDQNGDPVWTDLNRTKQVNGVLFVLPMAVGALTVGQRGVDPPQVVLGDTSGGLNTVWSGSTDFPPQLTLGIGKSMVGIAAGNNPVFVTSPYGAYVPPPAPPQVSGPPTSPMITFPDYRAPNFRSYGRPGYSGAFNMTNLRSGDFSGPGLTEVLADGTVDVGNQKVRRPFFVTLQSTHCTVEQTLGFFAGPNDDSRANAGIKASWEWQKSHGYPKSELIRYFDGPEITQEFIDKCEPGALVVAQCIPLNGESVSTSLARFRLSVDRINRSGRRSGIVRAFNLKYGGVSTDSVAQRLSRVLAVQEGLCDIVFDYQKCMADLWFSWGRWADVNGLIVDCGAAYLAELQAVAQKLSGLFTGLP